MNGTYNTHILLADLEKAVIQLTGSSSYATKMPVSEKEHKEAIAYESEQLNQAEYEHTSDQLLNDSFDQWAAENLDSDLPTHYWDTLTGKLLAQLLPYDPADPRITQLACCITCDDDMRYNVLVSIWEAETLKLYPESSTQEKQVKRRRFCLTQV